MGRVGDPAVHQKVPPAGDDHDLVDLGDRDEFVEDPVERRALRDLQSDDESEWSTDERRLDHHRVPADDAGLLEPRHALADRSGGHAEPAGDGARGQAGVLAQDVDDLSIEVVEVERSVHHRRHRCSRSSAHQTSHSLTKRSPLAHRCTDRTPSRSIVCANVPIPLDSGRCTRQILDMEPDDAPGTEPVLRLRIPEPTRGWDPAERVRRHLNTVGRDAQAAARREGRADRADAQAARPGAR